MPLNIDLTKFSCSNSMLIEQTLGYYLVFHIDLLLARKLTGYLDKIILLLK